MRLNLHALSELPAAIQRSTYDPSTVGVGIVHLGIGAFHRAPSSGVHRHRNRTGRR